jgi:hypothetical protein
MGRVNTTAFASFALARRELAQLIKYRFGFRVRYQHRLVVTDFAGHNTKHQTGSKVS